MTGSPGLTYPRTVGRARDRIVRDIGELLARLRRQGPTLHLGCGHHRIPGVTNCDLYHPGADRRLDAVSMEGVPDASVWMVEHHHMIEHLTAADLDRAVGQWARVLRPGGLLVFTAPDLERVLRAWLRMPERRRWSRGIRMIYGSQEHAGMFHRTGLTPRRASQLVAGAGLTPEWVYRGYPARPTPSFILFARKADGAP
jgi:predicted SAM-dependent methyltransferase